MINILHTYLYLLSILRLFNPEHHHGQSQDDHHGSSSLYNQPEVPLTEQREHFKTVSMNEGQTQFGPFL